MRFKHFLITRFSYKPDYKHLQERIDLFFKYTIPSIAAQFCKNFYFILITNSKIGIRPNIQYNESITVQIPEDQEICYSIPDILDDIFINLLEPTDEFIITTRLDNDDYILPTHIECIQNIFKRQFKKPLQNSLIETNGYWFDMREKAHYTNTRYKSVTSPFISLVENLKTTKIKTCYDLPHAKMIKKYPLIKSPEKTWIQIIHDYNLKMNRIKKGNLDGKKIESIPFFTG